MTVPVAAWQGSPVAARALDGLRGRRFPAFVVRPRPSLPAGSYSVCFAQFSFGLGVGDSLEEALEEAEYVLAYGLRMEFEFATRGQALQLAPLAPIEPVGLDEAQRLCGNLLRGLGLTVEDVDWITVELKPEAIAGEDWEWIAGVQRG